MYTALILLLLAISVLLISQGQKKRKKSGVVLGIIIILFTIVFFWFMGFWGDILWFQNLGYGNRIWKYVYTNILTAFSGAIIGLLIVFVLTLKIPKRKILLKYGALLFGVFAGSIWGVSNWNVILKFFYSVPTTLSDPIFGNSTSFYLFTLPFLDEIYTLLFTLTFISFAAVVASSYFYLSEKGLQILSSPIGSTSQIYINASVFILVLALGKFLARFHLLYSTSGVTAGPGWTDVHVVLPAYYVIVFLMILISIALLIPSIRKKIQFFFVRRKVRLENTHVLVLAGAGVLILVICVVGLSAIPGIFQSLMVQPNEITYEQPYITNNIKFTREGFGLNKVEQKEYPESGKITPEVVKNNPDIFSNIRLWDPRALKAVYSQFQEFRLYYEFSDVDVDRYIIDDQKRQVMISAREMNSSNLPAKSQTFVNQRFQYTHGYGITLATVNEFTQQGLPHLLVKDIPPKNEVKTLKVDQPRIYYGEITDSPVVVNTEQQEFDYPSGQDNVYTKYSGKGGVRISNFWRKFLFGWKFDGTKLLFSDYPTDQSRIMFHRQIFDRVKKLAPFLHFDKDAYIVLSGGQLYWIIDAYTASKYFPYSQPYNSNEKIEYKDGNVNRFITEQTAQNLNGMNYVRNSVKIVVNAFSGSVNFYIMDKEDPIIKVWDKIFPGLFKNKEEMPEDIYKHIRYPIDFLLVQGLVYEKYHMTDPVVFYNQEDLWVRATEKYYNHVQPVEPYYIMWQIPGSDKPQFSLILPFTPKNRQVLIGWIAGLCDPPNYGRFLTYQFPKDKTVLGPQQVETKIDQDSFLSGQLSLWDQRGSNVIRGNVLAIPVNNTMFYIEPIYLQAETAAYPELRLVTIMHGDNLSYAKNFEDALNGLFQKNPKVNLIDNEAQPGKEVPTLNTETIKKNIEDANAAFNNYLKLLGEKKFSEAAKQLETLQENLKILSDQSKGEK